MQVLFLGPQCFSLLLQATMLTGTNNEHVGTLTCTQYGVLYYTVENPANYHLHDNDNQRSIGQT
jgi:P pilus assembly chaperone PapD